MSDYYMNVFAIDIIDEMSDEGIRDAIKQAIKETLESDEFCPIKDMADINPHLLIGSCSENGMITQHSCRNNRATLIREELINTRFILNHRQAAFFR